jgi:hypothetical protein
MLIVIRLNGGVERAVRYWLEANIDIPKQWVCEWLLLAHSGRSA